MQQLTKTVLFAAVGLLTGAALVDAGTPENQGGKPAAKFTLADKAAYIGQPVGLVVQPETVRLAGPRGMRQVLVTGRYSDGSERDLTSFCDLHVENPALVKLSRGGLLQPLTAGETALVIQAGGQTARVPVVVTDFEKAQPVSFRHEFIAALNVAGCNAGACHGIPSGRGGFKLSLRGYDPAADFVELTHSAQGRRTNAFDGEASLILKKGLGLVSHEGGPRLLSANLVPQETVRAWLAEGLHDDPPARSDQDRSSAWKPGAVRAGSLAATGGAGPFCRRQHPRRHPLDRLQQ